MIHKIGVTTIDSFPEKTNKRQLSILYLANIGFGTFLDAIESLAWRYERQSVRIIKPMDISVSQSDKHLETF